MISEVTDSNPVTKLPIDYPSRLAPESEQIILLFFAAKICQPEGRVT